MFSNVSHIYGPDAPLLLTDPGDISFDPDGVTFPCDDSYDTNKPENYSENKYHGRLCDSEYEMCIGRQRCFPVDPDTGLYNESFPLNDDCYHNTTWPGWKGWFEKNFLIIDFCKSRKSYKLRTPFKHDSRCALFSLLSFVTTNSTPQREAQRMSCLKGVQRLGEVQKS